MSKTYKNVSQALYCICCWLHS